MPDLQDGESIEMQGSGKQPYILKNTGGVYSCTCPAWRNQSPGIEKRTCKHLRKLRGDAAETERVGNAFPVRKQEGDEDGDENQGPPLLLAHVWENDIDLAGWWMSEKLDGVCAYWDGKRFISRLGNEFHAPDWFIAGLPATPLDGELWVEQGVSEDGEHRPPAGQERPLEADPLRRLRRPGHDRPIRRAAEVYCRLPGVRRVAIRTSPRTAALQKPRASACRARTDRNAGGRRVNASTTGFDVRGGARRRS